MAEKLEVGMRVKASEEAKQQRLNVANDAKIKHCRETDELVTIEFTRKTGNRATERIHRDYLEPKR